MSAVMAGMGHALPAPYAQQAVWDEFFRRHYRDVGVAEQIFANSGVHTRHAVANPAFEDVSGGGTGRAWSATWPRRCRWARTR